MPNYVIAQGALKVGRDEFKGVGDAVSLEESFVKSVDPTGVNFVSEEKWLAMEELKELTARISALSDDERLEALKSVVAKSSAPVDAESTPKRRRGAQSEG